MTASSEHTQARDEALPSHALLIFSTDRVRVGWIAINLSFSRFVIFLIAASRFRAADSEDIFFVQTSVIGLWLRVYAAPFPAACFFTRASTSVEMPV